MNVTTDKSFPNAPSDWSIDDAKVIADDLGVTLTEHHLEVILALQEYYSKVEFKNLRQIKDALNEKFHHCGGMKYLYEILPGGPVAQGCQLSGLNIPAGAVDKSFGSVA